MELYQGNVLGCSIRLLSILHFTKKVIFVTPQNVFTLQFEMEIRGKCHLHNMMFFEANMLIPIIY